MFLASAPDKFGQIKKHLKKDLPEYPQLDLVTCYFLYRTENRELWLFMTYSQTRL